MLLAKLPNSEAYPDSAPTLRSIPVMPPLDVLAEVGAIFWDGEQFWAIDKRGLSRGRFASSVQANAVLVGLLEEEAWAEWAELQRSNGRRQ